MNKFLDEDNKTNRKVSGRGNKLVPLILGYGVKLVLVILSIYVYIVGFYGY